MNTLQCKTQRLSQRRMGSIIAVNSQQCLSRLGEKGWFCANISHIPELQDAKSKSELNGPVWSN
jgi:cell division protein ZapA (FtsZ GTPase activity inhibitor)